MDSGSGSNAAAAPQKKNFRQRAHCNPLSHNDTFQYPAHPDDFDWSSLYPAFIPEGASTSKEGGGGKKRTSDDVEGARHLVPLDIHKRVTMMDIGCGYGGLTVALAPVFPDNLILAVEIREKVTNYVKQRILHLRETNEGQYGNVACIRGNTMQHLVHFIKKGQLEKIFICFPDPHFKKKNHRRRIVSNSLLADYAYVLKPGGMLYTVTDVKELAEWHFKHCSEHPSFERVSDAELSTDPCVPLVFTSTEEGMKVERNHGDKHIHVYRRKPYPV